MTLHRDRSEREARAIVEVAAEEAAQIQGSLAERAGQEVRGAPAVQVVRDAARVHGAFGERLRVELVDRARQRAVTRVRGAGRDRLPAVDDDLNVGRAAAGLHLVADDQVVQSRPVAVAGAAGDVVTGGIVERAGLLVQLEREVGVAGLRFAREREVQERVAAVVDRAPARGQVFFQRVAPAPAVDEDPATGIQLLLVRGAETAVVRGRVRAALDEAVTAWGNGGERLPVDVAGLIDLIAVTALEVAPRERVRGR